MYIWGWELKKIRLQWNCVKNFDEKFHFPWCIKSLGINFIKWENVSWYTYAKGFKFHEISVGLQRFVSPSPMHVLVAGLYRMYVSTLLWNFSSINDQKWYPKTATFNIIASSQHKYAFIHIRMFDKFERTMQCKIYSYCQCKQIYGWIMKAN